MACDDILPERMVDRAVAIWKRALAKPEYHNTRAGEPEHGQWEVFNAVVLGGAPKNNTPEVLQRFGEALKDCLTNGVMYTPDYGDKEPYLLRGRSLNVDYHPDIILREAAARAGLKMEFPIKTGMWIADDCISFAMGYGAPHTYHYPLPDGRWLTTSFRGNPQDTAALVAYVMANGDLPFTKTEAADD